MNLGRWARLGLTAGIGILCAVPLGAELGKPYRLEAVQSREDLPPPLLGEHTDEVLREAGYADEEIDEFRKSEIVF